MTPVQIKALRLSNNKTQIQAADLLWVTTRAYQMWEAGDRPMTKGMQELFIRKLNDFCPNCGRKPPPIF